MNLLRSEWLKLRTTRTTWEIVAIGLLAEAAYAGLYTALTNVNNIQEIEDFGNGIALLRVLTLVLGVLIITTEFRHGTSSSTFLASPSRYPVLIAKLVVALLLGLALGVAFAIVNGGLGLPILGARAGGASFPPGEIASFYGAELAVFALLCAFGFGVGAIIRNQATAIIAAIAFFFVLSPLPELLPGSIADYFPAQSLGSLAGNSDEGLSQVAGGFVFAAWSFGLAAIGTALVARGDVD